MNIRTTVILMTSATALVACRGNLMIGDEDEGGVHSPDSGSVSDAAVSEPTQGPDGSGIPTQGFDGGIAPTEGFDGSISVVVDASSSPLIVFDSGVGGLCAGVDAGSVMDACPGCTRRPGRGSSYYSCPPG